MWNDNETNIDLIDLSHLVNSITRIINDDNLVPSTIGIFGDWGSGKSSLLKMVEDSYVDNKDVLSIKFNGWLFEGYEDAKSVLMGTILEQIIKNRTLDEKAKAIAIKLLKRIDWFKIARSTVKYGISFVAAGPVGVGLAAMSDIPAAIGNIDYEKFISEGSEQQSLRMSIQDFHKDFTQLLAETKIKRLIVFIDDLDRCNPDTVIETLEAIKLFLYVDGTVFIISADERLIEYSVRKRFPELSVSKNSVSRDYLEKLIQHPIRIPQLNKSEIETYINLLFTFLHLDAKNAEETRIKVIQEKRKSLYPSNFIFNNAQQYIKDIEINSELKDDLLLSSQITPILSAGLNGNPRQCKRFLNMLMIRFKIAEDKNLKIEKRILSKIMLLEYFRPESFKALFDLQKNQDGKPLEIKQLESQRIVKSTKSKGAPYNDAEQVGLIDNWLKDKWLKEWCSIEPQLTDIDLQPYFYLTRDRLSFDSSEIGRMSANIQEIFGQLISESDAIKNKGLEQIKLISASDASTIFISLTKKITSEENESKRERFVETLNEFSGHRKELLSELVLFYNKFPEKYLTAGIVPQLKSVLEGTEYISNLEVLISKWSKSTENRYLALACKQKGV